MKRRLIFALMTLLLGAGMIAFDWPRNTALALPDCVTFSKNLDGRCLNESYFAGIDFGASIVNGGYGSTGVWANAGAPNAGNLCAAFQNTTADITGGPQCGLWSYVDPLGSDGLDKWAFPDTTEGQPGSAAAFVSFIGDYLNYTEPGCVFNNEFVQPSAAIPNYDACQYYDARILGAAYIVLTMIGPPYTTYDVGTLFNSQVNAVTGPYNDVQAGIADARSEFGAWSAEIMSADAAGEVQWDTVAPPSVALADHPNTSSVDWDHDEEMREEAPQARHAIVFNFGGGQYILNRRCGNSDGFATLPPPSDMNMQTSVGGLFDASGNPVTQLTPGGTYTIHPSVSNTGNANSNTVYLELQTPGNTGNVAVDAADAPYGVASGYSAVNNCAPGYPAATVVGSPPGACAGPHWWWEYNNIPAPSPLLQQTVTFSVSAGAAIGSSICFQSDVTHEYIADPTSYAVSPVVCYAVASPRYPSVTGLNGDIHAGGGLCDGTLSNGYIQGNNNANSYGQYVVSAAGTPVSNFGSNGPGTSTLLNMGVDGGYSQVCREDIYKAADDYITNGGAVTGTYGPGSYDISGWSGIVNVTGTVNICGVVSNQTTIVETNPAAIVYFGGAACVANGGNTSLTGVATAANALPSLSVISAGDIDIVAATTRVDAYLFTDGTIETRNTTYCTCEHTLIVNGFLMAHNIILDRLGPVGTRGQQLGEQIVLNPQIYLNPPPFFTSAVDTGTIQGLGEKPPLF